MVFTSREIEVERVINLVRGFGWEKVKEEIVGGKLQLTIEKEMEPAQLPESEAPPT